MLLVVPVSLSDQKNLPGIEKAFEVFSPGSGHKLLVIGSPNVTVAVRETAQKLSKHFAGSAKSYIFDLDCELGWPSACNYYFQQAAWYVGSSYDEPWLWFEPDTTPIRAGWLDEIEQAVNNLKAEALTNGEPPPRYFGVREPACTEHQGRLMANAGDQMAAVGVYPSNMEDVLSLRAISSTNIVWNTFLRWYFLPHFAELPMIQNNWRTANYRIAEDGRIECDSVANWAWDVHFNKSIFPDAAIVHGCKDGSLLEVIREANTPTATPQTHWTDYREPSENEKVEKVRAAQRKIVESKAVSK
jgi:hypothetical protein